MQRLYSFSVIFCINSIFVCSRDKALPCLMTFFAMIVPYYKGDVAVQRLYYKIIRKNTLVFA